MSECVSSCIRKVCRSDIPTSSSSSLRMCLAFIHLITRLLGTQHITSPMAPQQASHVCQTPLLVSSSSSLTQNVPLPSFILLQGCWEHNTLCTPPHACMAPRPCVPDGGGAAKGPWVVCCILKSYVLGGRHACMHAPGWPPILIWGLYVAWWRTASRHLWVGGPRDHISSCFPSPKLDNDKRVFVWMLERFVACECWMVPWMDGRGGSMLRGAFQRERQKKKKKLGSK
jgi:hypothetical protein